MTLPQSIEIQPLNFERNCRKTTDGSTLLLIVAAAVVMFILFSPTQPTYTGPVNKQKCMAMVSQVSDAFQKVSARLTAPTTTLPDASTVYPVKKGSTSLCDCDDAATTPEGYKSMSDASKKKNAKNALNWMKENDTALIMVFAPWCSHCHKAMQPFVDAASQTSVPSLMLNAETVPNELFVGPNALFALQYFPTFLVKKGKDLKLSPSPQAAAEEVMKQSSSAQPAPQPAPAPSPSETEATAFDNLF